MSTDFVDPNGDVTTQWEVTPAGTHFSTIDDGVRQPTEPGYLDYIEAHIIDVIDTFDMTPLTVTSVSNITVWSFGRSEAPASGVKCTCSINTGSGWADDVDFSFTTSYTWKSVSFDGTWTQAELNALQVRLTKLGSLVAGGIWVICMYALVTYTAGTNYDETGRSTTLKIGAACTDTQAMNERGLSQSVSLDAAGTDRAAFGEECSVPLKITTSELDRVNMVESGEVSLHLVLSALDNIAMSEAASQTIRIVVTGSDVQAMVENPTQTVKIVALYLPPKSEYDETDREVTIKVNATASDILAAMETGKVQTLLVSTSAAETLWLATDFVVLSSEEFAAILASTGTTQPLDSEAFSATLRKRSAN